MSQDNQEFESLRRLLALKRHEQPPPGYFNDFSSQVIARIRAGERVDEGGFDRMFWEAPWLQRLWAAIETKPIMAGAFGAAVCALLVGGVLYSDRTEVPTSVAGPAGPALMPMQIANNAASDEQILGRPASSTGFGENSPLQDSMAAVAPSLGLFEMVPKPKPASASLTLSLPGGN
jgi:hypothetical protein